MRVDGRDELLERVGVRIGVDVRHDRFFLRLRDEPFARLGLRLGLWRGDGLGLVYGAFHGAADAGDVAQGVGALEHRAGGVEHDAQRLHAVGAVVRVGMCGAAGAGEAQRLVRFDGLQAVEIFNVHAYALCVAGVSLWIFPVRPRRNPSRDA